MDYKYIEQLLERYWACETTLEEENILRAFFSQDDVPVSLLRYKSLFAYMQAEPRADVLGADFDERVLAQVEQPTVKARIIPMQARLMPLFKAAAVVAIFLSLGNALQMAFHDEAAQPVPSMAGLPQPKDGPAMAKADTLKADTLKAAIAQPILK